MPEDKPIKHCAYCRAVLFDEDDVVWCPECGAPHHRSCYQQLGHCARIERHGMTESEPEEMPVAPMPEPEETKATDTPFEQTWNPAQAGGPFDPYNGVDPHGTMDGVPTEEVAAFVRVNTRHYLPRFEQMTETKRAVSWNWGGFLFGPSWLFFRKCYPEGIGLWLADLAADIMMTPLMTAIATSGLAEQSQTGLFGMVDPIAVGQSQQAMLSLMADKPWATVLCVLGIVLAILLRVLIGLFGTKMYLRRCLNKVKVIREAEDIDNKLQTIVAMGGVNIWLALLSWYAPNLLSMLL